MTMAARRGFEESDSEDDGSSVASDWTAQSEQRSSYPVDHILAEKEQGPGQILYLVKWTGYPEERSTWEPSVNLGGNTIDQWMDQKNAIRRGFDKPFDLVTWEEKQAIIRDANSRRWKQRARRLAKQGRSVDPPEDHPAAEAGSSSDDLENSDLFVSPPKSIDPAVGRKTSAARSRSRVHAAANRETKRIQGQLHDHSIRKIIYNQVEQKMGAEIMANFAEEPRPKRKRKPGEEERLYQFASHRWYVQSYNTYSYGF
jgi:hypothetical protein